MVFTVQPDVKLHVFHIYIHVTDDTSCGSQFLLKLDAFVLWSCHLVLLQLI